MVFEILTVVNTVAILVLAYDITRVARMRKQSGAPRDADHVETMLGFGPHAVAPHSTFIFMVDTRTDFKGKRLVIPSTIAESFDVCDLRASGDKSMNRSNKPIPGSTFSEMASAPSDDLDMPEAKAGKTFVLSVSNRSNAAHTFSAALMGLAPKEQFDALSPLVRAVN